MKVLSKFEIEIIEIPKTNTICDTCPCHLCLCRGCLWKSNKKICVNSIDQICDFPRTNADWIKCRENFIKNSGLIEH